MTEPKVKTLGLWFAKRLETDGASGGNTVGQGLCSIVGLCPLVA